jgi:hypothetical protein
LERAVDLAAFKQSSIKRGQSCFGVIQSREFHCGDSAGETISGIVYCCIEHGAEWSSLQKNRLVGRRETQVREDQRITWVGHLETTF